MTIYHQKSATEDYFYTKQMDLQLEVCFYRLWTQRSVFLKEKTLRHHYSTSANIRSQGRVNP